ncbi:hypothetical protein QPK24_11345 [Paenibacillus polygoni]|uniref:Uncharacterized protein n=1 Tax=Paenibacillus polygoni TaxID=3050112 RepID=A0ABY8XCB7_9BACL|nr:hypothetical protein [Paenibacillus polygoni]WIV21221.1 hypothetical protein QPK24_11345 [Paenibacillus polygoni]
MSEEFNHIINKKYQIKILKAEYIQVTYSIFLTIMVVFTFGINDLLGAFFVVFVPLYTLLNIVMLLMKILRKNNELQIKEDGIQINHIEIPKQKIEKIIIQGYFVQSVGIKLYGRKFVPMKFHFRFKAHEEVSIEELKQWASMNQIKVTSGKIYRLI